MSKISFPPSVQVALWSYDLEKMDIERNKERIITNVLNYGTEDAVEWLRETYNYGDIVSVVSNPRPGEWNKKSLNFWSIVYGVTPKIRTRF